VPELATINRTRHCLLGLTGAAGAGKDSAAAVLVRHGWLAMAFADALRIEACTAWGIDIRPFCDRRVKEHTTPQLAVGLCMNASFLQWAAHLGLAHMEPRSPRWVMQAWGTFRRQQNPLYWVQQVQRWVMYQRSTGRQGLVLTDVRFDNEAAMLRQLGGHLVRVHRPELPTMATDTAAHPSEQHIHLRADADLHNDGDLQHLEAEVARVVLQLANTPKEAHEHQ
jgi:hypothetical protein